MERFSTIKIGTPDYPGRLASTEFIEPPPILWANGPVNLIAEPIIGLFCSSQCPGSIILKTFDAMTKMQTKARF